MHKNVLDLNRVLFIVGPTASGKSSLAIQIAKQIQAQGDKAIVISADSRQIYLDLDIITGKEAVRPKPYPDSDLRYTAFDIQGVPHFMIDILPPTQSFTLFDFQETAQKLIQDNIAKSKVIVAGGTGLYIDSLINNYQISKNQTFDKELRKTLENDYQKLLLTYPKAEANLHMHQKLMDLDETRADKINPQNIYSVLRELEVIMQTGKPKDQVSTTSPADFPYDLLYICPDRQKLYQKINHRVLQMFEMGLEQEAQKVLKQYDPSLPSISSIGYPEFQRFQQGQISKSELIELIQQNSRKYAKRQFTWFNRYLEDPNSIVIQGDQVDKELSF